MKSTTPSSLRSFFRLLNARTSISGSRLERNLCAFHSTDVSCSRSKSASNVLRPRQTAPTASSRASALLPTPPFWPTNAAVVGVFTFVIVAPLDSGSSSFREVKRSAKPYLLAHLLIILLLEPLVDELEDSPRWAEGLAQAA